MNKTLLILNCILILQLINCQTHNTINKPNNIFLKLNKSIPNNWKYIEYYSVNKLQTPKSIDTTLLRKPINIIYFYKSDILSSKDTPSVVLYFYPKIDELKLNKIIEESSIFSCCIPIHFANSKEYVVIATPCDLYSDANYKDSAEVKPIIANLMKYIETN